MPRIPDALLSSVAFFYPSAQAAESNRPAGGTGFFVTSRARQGRTFVVTNNHVVNVGCTVLRRKLPDGTFAVVDIPIEKWSLHDEGDDVAVAEATPYLSGGLQASLVWEDVAATPERLRELNVGVGDDVFMVGRFILHSGTPRNEPLARFGNIAMMPGERVVDGRGLAVDAYLVEMRSLAGFSGSPVFVYIGPGTYRGNEKMMPFFKDTIGLIGIDSGHKSNHSPVLSQETRQPVDDLWYVPQNTGISIVTPVSKIAEVLGSIA